MKESKIYLPVSIHQPETYPQIGYFNKILKSDVFIFLDNVSYRKNYYQNRNKILNNGEELYLSLPVGSGGNILDKTYDRRYIKKHQKTLSQIYSKSPTLKIIQDIITLSDERAAGSLANYNIHFIREICHLLDIRTLFKRSCELDVSGQKSDLIRNLVKSVEGGSYLSGKSGREYLNLDDFKEEGVLVWFQDFNYPERPRCSNKYISILDFLLIDGIDVTKDYIEKGDNWCM